jgi:uncharacterized damage-inducible protein DinB
MTKLTDSLKAEYDREAQTTRRHLERLPGDKLDWRPHAKSFTAAALASHIVECIGWADSILTGEEFDFDPASYKPYRGESVADILKTFDARVESGQRAFAHATDEMLMQPWRLKVMGRVRFERPRSAVLRDFTLSHVIHHRGQFSVYLRLLDVPVPGSYGPSADENP